MTKEAMIHYGCCSARLPLDEKLFERDLQAALQMSKQSTEDDKDVITGLMDEGIITLSVAYIIHIIWRGVYYPSLWHCWWYRTVFSCNFTICQMFKEPAAHGLWHSAGIPWRKQIQLQRQLYDRFFQMTNNSSKLGQVACRNYSLWAAVIICATLINPQTHSQLLSGCTISPASWAKSILKCLKLPIDKNLRIDCHVQLMWQISFVRTCFSLSEKLLCVELG